MYTPSLSARPKLADILVSDYPIVHATELLGSWGGQRVAWIESNVDSWTLTPLPPLSDGQQKLLRIIQVILLPFTMLAIIFKAIRRSMEIKYFSFNETNKTWEPNPLLDATFKKKKAIIVIGNTASGKTTLRKQIIDHTQTPYVIVDADQIKEIMPAYGAWVEIEKRKIEAANLTHVESCNIRNLLFAKALRSGSNMIIDSTGTQWAAYKTYVIDPLLKSNYEIELIWVDTSLDTCLKRAEKRAVETGRYVAESIIKQSALASPLAFNNLRPYVHHWKHYKNDGAFPVLIELGSTSPAISQVKA